MPLRGLIDRDYIRSRAGLIDPERSMGRAKAGDPPHRRAGLLAPSDGIENGTCDAITFSSMSLPNLLENYPDLKKVELADGEGFSDPSNPDNAAIAKGQDAVLAKINEVIDGISADERQSMWDDCMDRQPA